MKLLISIFNLSTPGPLISGTKSGTPPRVRHCCENKCCSSYWWYRIIIGTWNWYRYREAYSELRPPSGRLRLELHFQVDWVHQLWWAVRTEDDCRRRAGLDPGPEPAPGKCNWCDISQRHDVSTHWRTSIPVGTDASAAAAAPPCLPMGAGGGLVPGPTVTWWLSLALDFQPDPSHKCRRPSPGPKLGRVV